MLFGMDDRMARRAWPALLLGLLQTATAVPAAEPELAALLARNTYAIRIEGREISGPGLAWIESQAAEAHFFLLGEQHATADIAHLSDGLFERLNALGYSVAAVEVGPWSASLMEAMLRRDGGEPFEHYLRDPSHRLVFPFFSFSEPGTRHTRYTPRAPGSVQPACSMALNMASYLASFSRESNGSR